MPTPDQTAAERLFHQMARACSCPRELCITHSVPILLAALRAERDHERERAKDYLEKICWPKEDIEAFDRWGR